LTFELNPDSAKLKQRSMYPGQRLFCSKNYYRQFSYKISEAI